MGYIDTICLLYVWIFVCYAFQNGECILFYSTGYKRLLLDFFLHSHQINIKVKKWQSESDVFEGMNTFILGKQNML